MLTVEFYNMKGGIGRITWDGREFSCDPDTDRLKRIPDEPIFVSKAGGLVKAKDDPELFMRNLGGHYRSAYFNAGEAEET